MNNLNLENPIIVLYLNVENLSRSQGEEKISQVSKMINYDNITTWVIPVRDQETKMEIIWKGSKYQEDINAEKQIHFVHKRLSTILELISEGVSDPIIRQKLREMSLKTILD